MNPTEQQAIDMLSTRTSAIALDVGSHSIDTIRREGLRLISRTQATTYAVLPAEESTKQILNRAGVSFSPCDEGLVVLGDLASEVARSFGLPVIPALPAGRVPKNDIVGRQVLSLLVDTVLPVGQGTSICMIAMPSDDDATEQFFAGLVKLRGHVPVLMNSAAAAGLITLARERLTGLSIDAGASRCGISVISNGYEVMAATLPGGATELDKAFEKPIEHRLTDRHGNQYRDLEAARLLRESISRDKLVELDDRRITPHRDLADALASLVVSTFEDASLHHLFRRPTAISACGGLVRDQHFATLLTHAIEAVDSAAYFSHPISIETDQFAIARGLLMAAEVEAETLASAAA